MCDYCFMDRAVCDTITINEILFKFPTPPQHLAQDKDNSHIKLGKLVTPPNDSGKSFLISKSYCFLA